MQDKRSNYFLFVVLIAYVMLATSGFKGLNNYLQKTQMDPTMHQLVSIGALFLLGGGLILLNKMVQSWLNKRNH